MNFILERRRRMLTLLLHALMSTAALVVLATWATDASSWLGSAERQSLAVNMCFAMLGLGTVLLLVKKRMPPCFLGTILLLFVVIALVVTDAPENVAGGRSVFWFAFPILAASMIIGPWASVMFAAVSALLVAWVSVQLLGAVPNWVALVGFAMLSFLAWAYAASLERSLRQAASLTEALRDSEERYRGIFEHSPSGICLLDMLRDEKGVVTDFRYVDVNHAFETQTGLMAQSVIGQAYADVVPYADTNELFVSTYAKLVETGESIQFQQYSQALDRTLEIAAFPHNQDQFVTICTDISERVRHDQERERLLADVRRQAYELHSILEAVPVAVVMLDASRRILLANALAETLLADVGVVEKDDYLESLAGQPLTDILYGPAQRYWQAIDAGDTSLEVTARPVNEDSRGGWVLVVRDVTQEREFERRLRQQDRLAVIGQLAGGIAHDFNNLLTSILGFSEFALTSADPGSEQYDDLTEVRLAAERAASLTQQLLAFSRRQLLKPQVVSLCQVIADMRRMLDGLLEEAIELRFELTPDSANINVDPVQMQQVVMNLAVNARDAMPDGGRLTIGVQNVTLGIDEVEHVLSGDYVMLSVADTGVGMTDQVKRHLYEPFFTTKDVGKGTGLGLATVYGIVRQSEGRIVVDSTPGEGTTFRIYFPPATGAIQPDSQEADLALLPHGDEVILLVEDEAAVRRLARRELEGLGYVVLEAERPSVAMALSRAAQTIDLLLTDVVMPEMDGAALATAIRQERPGLRVLYVSGYTDRNLHEIAQPGTRARFMEKPYRAGELATMVRSILDEA